MPNVLTADVLRKLNLPTEKFNAAFEGMMKAGLERLGALQRPTGGWGWFDNDAEDSFMTACAVHGLSECSRLGFKVDGVALTRGRERLREMARQEQDPNRLAYMGYVLGEEFDRLLEVKDLSSYARALLVLSLHRARRAEAAEQARLLARAVKGNHWETPAWYYKWDDAAIETTAYAIQALIAVDPKNALIPKATDWLLAQRQGNRWRSTKDTAVAIVTLLQATTLEKLAGAVGGDGPAPQAAANLKSIGIVLDGGERRQIQVDLNNPLHSVSEAHFPGIVPGSHAILFEKADEQSDFKFELELTHRVFDERVGSEARGVSVHVEYDRPLTSLRLGDEVTATVVVQSSTTLDYVMVLSPIPAGAEVIRGSGVGTFARFEDRYEKAIFFLRQVDDQPQRLSYRLRCGFGGRFTILPAWAGPMYNEEIYGTGRLVEASIAP